MKRLKREFYNKSAIELAKDLLGKIIVRAYGNVTIKSKIVETEAYVGPEDKACHAYNNKRTKRTEPMFKIGGFTYVYLIYGIHNLLNIVANDENIPEAVLIRAVEPISNLNAIYKNRDKEESFNKINLTNGPGKLSEALNINKNLNSIDLVQSDRLFLLDNEESFNIVSKKRINIDYAEEYIHKKWRFYIKNNKYISVK